MSDEFDIIDDDEEAQTIVLDEDELEDDGDIQVDDDGGDEGDFDDGFDDEDDFDVEPTTYRPGSNVYAVMLVLSFMAYAAALAIVLNEMQPYCEPDKFLWGIFK